MSEWIRRSASEQLDEVKAGTRFTRETAQRWLYRALIIDEISKGKSGQDQEEANDNRCFFWDSAWCQRPPAFFGVFFVVLNIAIVVNYVYAAGDAAEGDKAQNQFGINLPPKKSTIEKKRDKKEEVFSPIPGTE